MLREMRKAGCISYDNGGDGFEFRVRKDESAIGGSTSDWAEGSAKTTNPWQKITGDYRQYIWRIMFSDFQKQRNENADVTGKMFRMVAQQLAELQQSAMGRIHTHIFGDGSTQSTGDVGTPMEGFESIFDDDNTFMGIASGTDTWWQAQVHTQAEASFTADSLGEGVPDGIRVMKQAWIAASTGKDPDPKGGISKTEATEEDAPSMTICDSTRFLLYERCLMPQRQYTSAEMDPKTNLMFQGKPIEWDARCTASRFYMPNWRHLHLEVVGSSILRLLKTIEHTSPLAQERAYGGQWQLYPSSRRNMAVVQLT